MNKQSFDVIIVGAGPAGCTAALALSESTLNVALIDKSTFPRDKICGDALSPDVVAQLQKLPIDASSFTKGFDKKLECKAVRFIAPNYSFSNISLVNYDLSGYISPRIDFDNYLFEQAKQCKNLTIFEGQEISSIEESPSRISVLMKSGDCLESPVILGSDGAQSLVKRTLHNEKPDKNHYCAGIRMYFEGVTGFTDLNAVELHFYNELLPGYFWIFPLPDNRANVGIGMLSSFVSKKNINLKKELISIIKTHPNVKDRFINAKIVDDAKGFPLPLGSKKRSISGDRYLLLGDAASLINPLSGEGIANAIRSGRVAADHVIQSHLANRFDAAFNKGYDKEIYRRMWYELRLNYWTQLFMRNPKRCNWIIQHAINNPIVKSVVMSGFNAKNAFSSLIKA